MTRCQCGPREMEHDPEGWNTTWNGWNHDLERVEQYLGHLHAELTTWIAREIEQLPPATVVRG